MIYPGCIVSSISGLELSAEDKAILEHPQLAGIVLFAHNYQNPLQLKHLIEQARRIRPNILVMVDHEGGRVFRFTPGFTSLPAARHYGDLLDKHGLELAKKDLTRDVQCASDELRAVGIDVNLSPVLDLDCERNKALESRCYHELPSHVSELASCAIEAMHHRRLQVVAKHFPGHGWVEEDSHDALPYDTRSLEVIEKTDMQPFLDLLARVDLIMPAHIIFSQVDPLPVTFSHYWIREYLKKQLGFKGVVISDDLSMQACQAIADTVSGADAAIEAGCDLALICHDMDKTFLVLEHFERQGRKKSSDALHHAVFKANNNRAGLLCR